MRRDPETIRKKETSDFLRLAEEYFRALKFLDEVHKDKIPDISQINTCDDYERIRKHPGYELLFDMMNVKLFLARHSLELILKTFLRYKGVIVDDLKRKKLYHHDLVKCYRGAKEKGLKIYKDPQKTMWADVIIGDINKYWMDKIYEYPNKIEKGYGKDLLNIISDIFVCIKKEVKL